MGLVLLQKNTTWHECRLWAYFMYQTIQVIHWLREINESQPVYHADELLTESDVILPRHLNEKAVCHNLD